MVCIIVKESSPSQVPRAVPTGNGRAVLQESQPSRDVSLLDCRVLPRHLGRSAEAVPVHGDAEATVSTKISDIYNNIDFDPSRDSSHIRHLDEAGTMNLQPFTLLFLRSTTDSCNFMRY